jgi:hypothetical protein
VDQEDPEIGWMILPEFQNRGIASQAVREVLERARVEQKFGQIHAFPALGSAPRTPEGLLRFATATGFRTGRSASGCSEDRVMIRSAGLEPATEQS